MTSLLRLLLPLLLSRWGLVSLAGLRPAANRGTTPTTPRQRLHRHTPLLLRLLLPGFLLPSSIRTWTASASRTPTTRSSTHRATMSTSTPRRPLAVRVAGRCPCFFRLRPGARPPSTTITTTINPPSKGSFRRIGFLRNCPSPSPCIRPLRGTRSQGGSSTNTTTYTSSNTSSNTD